MSVTSATDCYADLALAPLARAIVAKQHERRRPPTRMVFCVRVLRLEGHYERLEASLLRVITDGNQDLTSAI